MCIQHGNNRRSNSSSSINIEPHRKTSKEKKSQLEKLFEYEKWFLFEEAKKKRNIWVPIQRTNFMLMETHDSKTN